MSISRSDTLIVKFPGFGLLHVAYHVGNGIYILVCTVTGKIVGVQIDNFKKRFWEKLTINKMVDCKRDRIQ